MRADDFGKRPDWLIGNQCHPGVAADIIGHEGKHRMETRRTYSDGGWLAMAGKEEQVDTKAIIWTSLSSRNAMLTFRCVYLTWETDKDNSMKQDYHAILVEYGVHKIPEPEDTVLAFYHEIANTLFDDDSPFDFERSKIVQMPNCLEHMIQCSLKLKKGESSDKGIAYFEKKWSEELRYQNAKLETIDRTDSPFGTDIRILTIGNGGAVCSFLFTIVDESACDAVNDFIDGYDAADAPDALLENLRKPE